jgi:hypothetical protein
MALYAKKQEFEQPPTGSSQGVLAFISDIGLQESSFEGNESINHQAIFTFELAEQDSKGNSFTISIFYNLLLGKKAKLRKDLESWHGRVFTEEDLEKLDLESLIGKNALLNIGLSGTGKAKIVGISPTIKGMADVKVSITELPKGLKKLVDEKIANQVKEAPF